MYKNGMFWLTGGSELFADIEKGDNDAVRHAISLFDPSILKAWGPRVLCQAVKYKRMEIVKEMLSYDVEINSKFDTLSDTLLHIATENNDIEMIKMLLSRGAIVDAVNYLGLTPLHCAARLSGGAEIIEYLLKYKASVTACNECGETPLHHAVESGNLQNVELLLKHGAAVNPKKCKDTPLHLAAMNDYMEIAECLVNHGANVDDNICDYRGYTVLQHACLFDNEKLVKLLLSSGADIKVLTYDKSTTLHLAAGRKLEKNVKVLLDHGGADINARDSSGYTFLDLAVQNFDCKSLVHILKSRPGIDDNHKKTGLKKALQSKYNCEDSRKTVDTFLKYGYTGLIGQNGLIRQRIRYRLGNKSLLYNAVRKGCLKIVEDFLNYTTYDYFSDQFSEGNTLLHAAALSNNIEVANLLAKAGLDVNAKNETGQTPIFFAVRAMCMDMIKWFLSNGACIKSRDVSGKTPLHFLFLSMQTMPSTNTDLNDQKLLWKEESTVQTMVPVKTYDENDALIEVEIAKLCLSRGADVDAQTNNGHTALHAAAADKRPKIVQVLLECNANVNCVATHDGNKTPLHYSAAAGSEIICRMLLESGAKVNAKDEKGRTPLHTAGQYTHEKVVEILLEYGAEIASKDKKNRTPLQIASAQGSSKIVKIFLHHFHDEMDSANK